MHPNFCPELAFFPYALGHLLASAAHSSPIIHATTKPTAHVFPTEGAHSFIFVFVSVCFVSTVLRKGGIAAKGAIPRRICVTVRLPVQLELCLAESALPWSSVVCGSRRHITKQQQRKKLPKGAMFNPRHAQSPAPNSRRSPKRGQKSATLAKPQGERPNVGLHARDRSENAIFRGPFDVSHFVIVSAVAGQ